MPHPDMPAFPADDAHEDALTADLFAALDESANDEGEPDAPSEPDAPAVEAPLPEAALREPYALPLALRLAVEPRSYQGAAVDAWLRADGRGLVVLPTGAGKTIVAFDAIARLGVRTLVVVPTIELLRQWRLGIAERLSVPAEQVGVIGGGERRLGPITVITYDSAAMPRRRLAGFGLIVFAAAHHPPAERHPATLPH